VRLLRSSVAYAGSRVTRCVLGVVMVAGVSVATPAQADAFPRVKLATSEVTLAADSGDTRRCLDTFDAAFKVQQCVPAGVRPQSVLWQELDKTRFCHGQTRLYKCVALRLVKNPDLCLTHFYREVQVATCGSDRMVYDWGIARRGNYIRIFTLQDAPDPDVSVRRCLSWEGPIKGRDPLRRCDPLDTPGTGTVWLLRTPI
jgi:hypothetical protein